MPGVADNITTDDASPRSRPYNSTAYVVRKLIWIGALLGIGAGAAYGLLSFQLADSAPQQAVAAGIGCFGVITPYVVARALDALFRSENAGGEGPMSVLQRELWHGVPADLGEMFHLAKGEKHARCALWTHQLGWELRLTIGADVVMTQVCRSEDEVFATGETWKAGLWVKGWK